MQSSINPLTVWSQIDGRKISKEFEKEKRWKMMNDEENEGNEGNGTVASGIAHEMERKYERQPYTEQAKMNRIKHFKQTYIEILSASACSGRFKCLQNLKYIFNGTV